MADAKKTSMFNQLLQDRAPAATLKQQYQQMLICWGTIPPHVPPSRTVTLVKATLTTTLSSLNCFL